MRIVMQRRDPGQDHAKRGGNAGAMENVENQTAVSHVSHRPLEIAQNAIPTFPPRRRRFPHQANNRTGKCWLEKRACRNPLRQGINQVFWVGLLWPVLK
jgi:hypothetical protein